jgi:hypothetical protein
MALDWSQLCILPARQSYIRQYGKMASGPEKAFCVLDGAPPHFHNEVRSYLDERFRNRWFGRGGPMEWPPRSPDLTLIDFFLWGLMKDNVYVHPLPTTLHQLKTRSERPVQTLIRTFCTTCGMRLNIGLMLLEPLVARTLNFINDKLLFMKLFQLVFQLVRVL